MSSAYTWAKMNKQEKTEETKGQNTLRNSFLELRKVRYNTRWMHWLVYKVLLMVQFKWLVSTSLSMQPLLHFLWQSYIFLNNTALKVKRLRNLYNWLYKLIQLTVFMETSFTKTYKTQLCPLRLQCINKTFKLNSVLVIKKSGHTTVAHKRKGLVCEWAETNGLSAILDYWT